MALKKIAFITLIGTAVAQRRVYDHHQEHEPRYVMVPQLVVPKVLYEAVKPYTEHYNDEIKVFDCPRKHKKTPADCSQCRVLHGSHSESAVVRVDIEKGLEQLGEKSQSAKDFSHFYNNKRARSGDECSSEPDFSPYAAALASTSDRPNVIDTLEYSDFPSSYYEDEAGSFDFAKNDDFDSHDESSDGHHDEACFCLDRFDSSHRESKSSIINDEEMNEQLEEKKRVDDYSQDAARSEISLNERETANERAKVISQHSRFHDTGGHVNRGSAQLYKKRTGNSFYKYENTPSDSAELESRANFDQFFSDSHDDYHRGNYFPAHHHSLPGLITPHHYPQRAQNNIYNESHRERGFSTIWGKLLKIIFKKFQSKQEQEFIRYNTPNILPLFEETSNPYKNVEFDETHRKHPHGSRYKQQKLISRPTLIPESPPLEKMHFSSKSHQSDYHNDKKDSFKRFYEGSQIKFDKSSVEQQQQVQTDDAYHESKSESFVNPYASEYKLPKSIGYTLMPGAVASSNLKYASPAPKALHYLWQQYWQWLQYLLAMQQPRSTDQLKLFDVLPFA